MARQQGAGLTRTVVSLGSPPRAAGPRPSHSLASGERNVSGGGVNKMARQQGAGLQDGKATGGGVNKMARQHGVGLQDGQATGGGVNKMARQQRAGLTRWQGNRGRGYKMASQQGAGLTRTVVSLGSPPRAAEPHPSHSLVSGEGETCQGAGLTRWQGNRGRG